MRLLVRGEPTDLFTIGSLARGLGRDVGSVRRLEADGVLPPTRFRTPGKTPAGQQRLYTRQQVLTAVAAAEQEGVLGRRPRRWDRPLVATW